MKKAETVGAGQPLVLSRMAISLVRQNADIPLMLCGRLDDFQFDKHLILRTKHQPLNQRVHGSSPCAPTIKINDLAHTASVAGLALVTRR